ncbi:uncharacterized protein LOC113339657 [Papaver somniferum]|uniref:uncharacterized protein LOC113339657 n=1 Tax=Papaver somniferum TaxID=3469 RepID=UPI000E6F74BC|nr:uncharacterized protein LOC113339657 [Papaver somniferum]
MRDYIDRARNIIYNLAAADTVVTESELRHCILAGLDTAYDAIVTSLTTSMGAMKLEDFITYILTYELRIENQAKSLHSQPVANVAASGPTRSAASSFSRPAASNFSRPPTRSSLSSAQQFSSLSIPARPDASNTSNHSSLLGPAQPYNSRTDVRLPCQLCGRKNHAANDCWNRLDRSFRPPQRHPPTSASRAYASQTGLLSTPPWTPDSGATDHITNYLSRLQFSNEYTGPDQIQMGNGSSIPISNVGSSVLGNPNRSIYREGYSSWQ